MARSLTDRTRSPPARHGATALATLLATGAAAFLAARSGAGRAGQDAARQRILVFDVNETLLNVEAIAPLFRRVFGDGRVLRE